MKLAQICLIINEIELILYSRYLYKWIGNKVSLQYTLDYKPLLFKVH